ncbi:MAG TPA: DUF1232 domain-containing protein [Gemmatimonadaceae bacterium]|nr:DUF1232 domain-containing protein [Gemmatimonadaceae bacterium]
MSPTTRSDSVRRRSSKSRPGAAATATPVIEPAAPRAGARRTVMEYVKQLPNYLRLLGGLITDRRVNGVDKLLVAGAIVYILSPLDFIPDFIPFLGEVDDLYLLVLALQRLVANAGRTVLLDHWRGSAADLADLNLRQALAAAAFFLPTRLRRRLRRRLF